MERIATRMVISMPLLRYLSNKADNHAQHLNWGYDSVSCEYATVRYSDVTVVNFFFSHSMHSTNFVKNDDTISYMIRINEIFISRSHSAFNRISSGAKEIGNDIRQEFEGHMNNVYRYILPGLFQRKALEVLANGEVEIASLKFKSDGTVVIDGTRHKMNDLDFTLANGQWIVKTTAQRTFFGNAKQVAAIPMSQDNAILIEPMLKFMKEL